MKSSTRILTPEGKPASKAYIRRLRALQPNYFLAVRLDDPGLQEEFTKFNHHVYQNSPNWSKYLIRPVQQHITLAVMHLANDREIYGASKLLADSQDLVDKYVGQDRKPQITLNGVDVFDHGRIVYAKIEQMPEEFVQLVRAMRLRFWAHGYADKPINKPAEPVEEPFPEDISEPSLTKGQLKPWSPHASLMKLRGMDIGSRKKIAKASLVKSKQKGASMNDYFGIPERVYETYRGRQFGQQTIASIELLSMLQPKDKAGYYQKVGFLDI